jgi:hypothetical protein
MLLVFINIGILLALLSQKKIKKYPLKVGLVFGCIKAMLYAAFGIMAASGAGVPEVVPVVIVFALVRGAIGFLAAWGLLVLLARIDQIEIANRLAPAGAITKQPSVVLEWLGVMATGVICALS